jgi:hypothetical protein
MRMNGYKAPKTVGWIVRRLLSYHAWCRRLTRRHGERAVGRVAELSLRSIFLALAPLCVVVNATAADAQFPTVANAPDYVATFVEHAIYRKDDVSLTASHHRNWTRTDRVAGTQRSTEYVSADGMTSVSVYGSGATVSFAHGVDDYEDKEPRNTGRQETHLGENCTVWDVRRMNPLADRLTDLRCITDDGIDLWRRTVSVSKVTSESRLLSSSEASRIDRKPVPPEQAEPPRALLMLDWWDGAAAAPAHTPAKPDYETVMENSGTGSEQTLITTRRHNSWLFVEETVMGVRRSLRITLDNGTMSMGYTSDESGSRKQLALNKSTPSAAGADQPAAMQPKDLVRTETVLGESCRWFFMTPGLMDAGRSACLTTDGIALKEETWERGRRRVWTAVSFARRPISIDEIKPPASILDPRTWGID